MKGMSSLLAGMGFGLALVEPFLQRIVCLANAVAQQTYVVTPLISFTKICFAACSDILKN